MPKPGVTHLKFCNGGMSYEIAIRPYQCKQEYDDMNISVKSLLNVFQDGCPAEGGVPQEAGYMGAGSSPPQTRKASQSELPDLIRSIHVDINTPQPSSDHSRHLIGQSYRPRGSGISAGSSSPYRVYPAATSLRETYIHKPKSHSRLFFASNSRDADQLSINGSETKVEPKTLSYGASPPIDTTVPYHCDNEPILFESIKNIFEPTKEPSLLSPSPSAYAAPSIGSLQNQKDKIEELLTSGFLSKPPKSVRNMGFSYFGSAGKADDENLVINDDNENDLESRKVNFEVAGSTCTDRVETLGKHPNSAPSTLIKKPSIIGTSDINSRKKVTFAAQVKC